MKNITEALEILNQIEEIVAIKKLMDDIVSAREKSKSDIVTVGELGDKFQISTKLSKFNIDNTVENLIQDLPATKTEFESFLVELEKQKLEEMVNKIDVQDLEQAKLPQPEYSDFLPNETMTQYCQRLKYEVYDALGRKKDELKDSIKTLENLEKQEKEKEKCQKLKTKLKSLVSEYDELMNESENKIKEIIMRYQTPIAPNSIVVYCWYRPGKARGKQKIFGFDSTGHISVAVRRKKMIDGVEQDETKYISFYPVLQQGPEQLSLLGKASKKFGIPSVDSRKGFFQPLEHDLYTLMMGNYLSYEGVTLDCSEEPCLDIDAMFELAQTMLNNEENKFNYYTDNCSKIGFRILQAGKSDNILPYTGLTKIVVSSSDVISYAEKLHYTQEQRKLSEKLTNSVTQKSRILRNLTHIKESIEHVYSNSSTVYEAKFDKEFAAQIVTQINEFIANIEQADSMLEVNNVLSEAYDYMNGLITTQREDELVKKFIERHIQPNLEKINAMLPTYTQAKVQGIFGSLEHELKRLVNNEETLTKESAVAHILQENANIFSNINQLINKNMSSNVYDALLTVSTQLQNLINKTEEDLNSLKSQLTSERYEVAKMFFAVYRLCLQNVLGAINQILYFEMVQELDESDPNNLFQRLYKLLSANRAKQIPIPANEKELISDMIAYLPETDIKDMLNQPLESYSTTKEAINQRIYKSPVSFYKNARKLRIQAQLILAGKAFFEDKINSKEFKQTLDVLSQEAIDDQSKKEVALVAESFDTLLGDKHQFLYSEILQKLDENNRNNLFQSINKILSININIAPTMPANVKALVLEMIADFPDQDNKDIKIIKNILKMPILSYSATRDAITQNFPFSKNTRGLHIQAQLILAVKAFIEGKIASDVFQRVFYDLAMHMTDSQSKIQIQKFVESFRIQSIVSEMDLDKHKHAYRKPTQFQVYDFQSKQIIGSDDPKEFLIMLPRNASSSMIANSSYKLIEDSINSVVSCNNYWLIIKEKTLAEFKDAIQHGFGRHSNSKANKSLLAQYNSISKKGKYDLSPAEAAFLNLYKGVELITDILNHQYSQDAIFEKFNTFKNQRQQYDNRISESPELKIEMEHFYKTIKAAALTKHVKDEAILADLVDRSNSLSNAGLSIKNNDDLATQYKHIIDNINALSKSANVQAEMTHLRKDIKDTLERRDTQNLKDVHAALKETLQVVNKQIYLEDKTLKSFLCEFLGIPVLKNQSIEALLGYGEQVALQESKTTTRNDKYYKLEVLEMINKFISGKLTEEEFYHALVSYIEDNNSPSSLPRWAYGMVYQHKVAQKYEKLQYLKDFTEKFAMKFASLEGERLGNVYDMTNMDQSYIPTVVSSHRNEANREITREEINARAKQDYTAYNWFSKNKRTYANAFNNAVNILNKPMNHKSSKQKVIDNLKLNHYIKRMAELHDKSPIEQKKRGF